VLNKIYVYRINKIDSANLFNFILTSQTKKTVFFIRVLGHKFCSAVANLKWLKSLAIVIL